MKTKRVFAGVVLAAATTLLLTGCFGQSDNVATKTPKPTSSLSGGSPAPVPTSTFVPTKDPNAPAGYAEYAASLFPDVKATKSFTKEQVQLALYTAYSYGQQAENIPYFISGQWARDGYRQTSVNQYLSNWYTDNALSALLANVSVIKTDVKSGQAVFSAFNFLPDAKGNYTVCSSTTVNCNNTGYPKVNGGVSYRETTDGRILVQLTVESRITMTLDGTKGYLPVTNKMTLYMLPNDSYKGDAGTYPFLIDGLSNDVDRPGFTS